MKKLPTILLSLTSGVFANLEVAANCEVKTLMGDWRQGAESRAEAETYQTRELAEALEQFQECMQKTMPLDDEFNAGSSQPTSGLSETGDTTDSNNSNSKNVELGEAYQTANSESQAASQSRADVTATLEQDQAEIALEGSYVRAIREAYEAETNATTKAALALEYKKLTNQSIE